MKYNYMTKRRNQNYAKWLFVLVSLLFLSTQVNSQDLKIRGKVVSASDNSVLPGVSIAVKGTSRGTLTDVNGDYEISAPSDSSLVFSFIGMKTLEVKINGRSTINSSLEDNITGLDEVVV